VGNYRPGGKQSVTRSRRKRGLVMGAKGGVKMGSFFLGKEINVWKRKNAKCEPEKKESEENRVAGSIKGS